MKKSAIQLFICINISLILLFPRLGITQEIFGTLDNPLPQAYSYFGLSLANVGDLDGDNVPDIAVGAPLQDVGGILDVGKVFVFSGSDSSLIFTLDSPHLRHQAHFGRSLTNLGDINGDSFPDIAVNFGSSWYSGGRIYVFSGSDGSLLYTIYDPAPYDYGYFGYSIAASGDLNSDGYNDIVAGAHTKGVGGRAFVFSGHDGVLLYSLECPNPTSRPYFGVSLASIGDITSDTIPDIAVGASGQDVGEYIDQGQVFVFSGSDGSLVYTINDPIKETSAYFGGKLAGVGDLNKDGVSDLVIGATGHEFDGAWNGGKAFVFSGLDGSFLFSLDSPFPHGNASFGFSLANIGDLNRDGANEIAVGARGQNVDGVRAAGQIFIYSGADGAFISEIKSPNPQTNSGFSQIIAGVGDINADSIKEIVVGAPTQVVELNKSQGQVFIFSMGKATALSLFYPLIQSVLDINMNQGIASSLDAKLDIVLRALYDLNNNNDVAAINALEAFINEVNAQSGAKISIFDAQNLILKAQEILNCFTHELQ